MYIHYVKVSGIKKRRLYGVTCDHLQAETYKTWLRKNGYTRIEMRSIQLIADQWSAG